MSSVLLPHLNGMSNYFNLGAAAPSAGGVASYIPSIRPQVSLGGGGYSNGLSVIAATPEMFGAVRNAQEEDREQSRATTAAIVGGIATVALSGLSACALRSYCNDRAELQKAINFKNILEAAPGMYEISPHQRGELTPVANKYIEILEAKCGRARNILILTGLALATGIAAFVGGMMSLKWLITASIIAAVVVASIAAFTVVWHCTENTELPPQMADKILLMREQLNQSA